MIFYTYMWLRENGTPYYVGKGKRNRAYYRHDYVGNAPSKERILIEPHVSEADAFESEKFLIAYYGRKDLGTGILVNHTDGGDGTSGYSYTEDQRKQRSNQLKGRKFSERTKLLMSASAKGKVISPVTRLRMSESHRGKPLSPEQRLAISQSQLGRKRGRYASN